MKRILAILGLFAITAGLAPALPITYDLIPSSNGPAAGGNTLIITNYSDVFGSDITNVVFSNSTQVVSSTNIPAKDTKWVCVIVPAHAAGEVDIVVQSSDGTEKTLSAHKYTYNPAGYIGTEWGETAGLPTNRYGIAAGVLSGKVYAVGGYTAVSNVYRYRGTNWEEVASLPEGRRNMAVGVYSGLLYAIGGADPVAPNQKTNVYAFNGTSWTEVAGLPEKRSCLGASVLSGQLYAVGGFANPGSRTNVYRFNSSSWTEVAGLPSARSYMGCVVFNDRLYVIGGSTNTGGEASNGATNVFMFDSETWTEVQGLPAKRCVLTACVWNERLYAIGGREVFANTPTNSVYRFDGTSWESVAGLPEARAMLASAVVGNQMLAIGGTATTGTVGTSSHTNVYFYPSGGVSPTFGSITGGYTVTISGENLGNGDVTNVTLCGYNRASMQSQSSTQIVIVAGAGGPGLGDVRVYSTSYGEIVKSNGFTYNGPDMSVLGTNGAAIASGASASSALGTDFGSLSWGSALTNTFAITNSGNTNLTISGVTTNGAGAAAFSISDLGFSIDVGGVSNFAIRFAPPNAGTQTTAVQIVNDSTTTPYIVYLTGTGAKHDQTITNFTPTNGSAFITTSTVGLAAQASSGLTVTNFTVGSGLGSISGLTNLTFTGTGSVSIVASRAGDTNWNAAPNVTNTFSVTAVPTPNGWLSINVTPIDGSWQLAAPVGYTGPTSGTGNLAAVSTPTGSYAITWGVLSGYYSPSNQSQFVTAGSTTIFAGVYTAAPAGAGSLTAGILPADVVAAGAQWRVDGGAWRVSGAIVTDLPAGTHTVNYSIVPSYTNPADQSVSISPNQLTAVQGTYRLLSGDAAYKPISADYDGDQLADPAICQPASGLWMARFSGIDYQWGRMTRSFGPGGYAPVVADFDGDRLADPGLYNTTNGEWRAMLSTANYTEVFVANLLGDAGSTAMAADFDGDGKADPTVYNPATGDWKVRLSSGGYLTFEADDLLGRTGFAAVAGDLDGDRLADPFVCDMTTGQCMALLSSLQYYRVETPEGFLGASEWLLALADYDGDGLADPAMYNPSTGTLAVRMSSVGYTLFILPEFLKP